MFGRMRNLVNRLRLNDVLGSQITHSDDFNQKEPCHSNKPHRPNLSICLLGFLFLLLCNFIAPDQLNARIYGTDDRLDEYEDEVSDAIKGVGNSTCVIVRSENIVHSDDSIILHDLTLTERFNLEHGMPACRDEPFRDQPIPGDCSAFLVAPNIIATAGHCIKDDEDCKNALFIFGFVMTDDATSVLTIESSEIYYGVAIIDRSYDKKNPDISDWALIRLDREVENHKPLAIRRSDTVAEEQNLLVVGHPKGLPRKYADNATVRDNSPSFYFTTNLDTYGGNSGSAVFNKDNLVVEGIHVWGSTGNSFHFDFQATDIFTPINPFCIRSVVCSNETGCGGYYPYGSATRTTEFSSYLRPVLLSPATEASSNHTQDIFFDWQDISGASVYELQVATSREDWTEKKGFPDGSLSKLIWNSSSAGTWDKSEIKPGERYYWTVNALGSNIGETGFSDPFTFVMTLDAPILNTPINGEPVCNPAQFNWEEVEGADAYKIQIAASTDGWTPENGFPDFLLEKRIEMDTSYDQWGWADEGKTYYWSVRAGSKDGGASKYSNPQSFLAVSKDYWIQQAKLTAEFPAADDHLGHAVAISGDIAVIGAYGANSSAGAAYLFIKQGYGWENMTQIARLTADDAVAGDEFGKSVAISDNTVVVGAWGKDDAGTNSGAVYVFEKGAGWNQTAKLTAGDAAENDWFGWSVAISGETVIVGANGVGSNSGAAYIFEKGSGWASGSGNQTAKLTANDTAANDEFGRSVAIIEDTPNGTFALVGAYGNASYTGAAYMFEKGIGWVSGSGNQTAKLTGSDAVAPAYFGSSVAISYGFGTGVIALAGAYGVGTSGAAYVFEEESEWNQTAKLTASDAASSDFFGWSVAVSGRTAIVGAWGDDDGGSTYVFRLEGNGTSWSDMTQTFKLTADDMAADDEFGRSVAISGNKFIVGANGDDDGVDASGSAYVFGLINGQIYRTHRLNWMYFSVGGDWYICNEDGDLYFLDDPELSGSVCNSAWGLIGKGLATVDYYNHSVTIGDIADPESNKYFVKGPDIYRNNDIVYDRIAAVKNQTIDSEWYEITLPNGDFYIFFAPIWPSPANSYIQIAKYDVYRNCNYYTGENQGRTDQNTNLQVDFSGRYVTISHQDSVGQYKLKANDELLKSSDQNDDAVTEKLKKSSVPSSDLAITVTDGAFSRVLTIGVDETGADECELAPPPLPPEGDAASFLYETNVDGCYTQIKDNSYVEKSFEIKYYYVAIDNNPPDILLQWDKTLLDINWIYTIVDNINGEFFSLDMSTTDQLAIASSAQLANGLRVVLTPKIPEINLKQGADDIADGGSYDFGSQTVGAYSDVVFTIENTGVADLTLTTPLTIGGADADQFSIAAKPASPVGAQSSTAFTVRFSPSSTGAKTATISIVNNDDDENPYDLTVTSRGTAIPEPEIELKQFNSDILDGGSYDFGTIAVGAATDMPFRIVNTGTADLTVTTPLTIGGPDADQFSIEAEPSSLVEAVSGDWQHSTAFTVRFSPTSAGPKTATISIGNNDSDENAYDLTIIGNLTADITSPALTSTLSSTSEIFTWNDSGADQYQLLVGTSQGADDLYSGAQGAGTTAVASCLPSDGSTIYVRLLSLFGGVWYYNDYTYTAADYKCAGDFKITASDGSAEDYFGFSVAISGDYAVVGVYYDDDNGSESGSAYIFYRSGAEWIQQAKLIASDAVADDYFGRSVAISGDTVIVGADGDDDSGSRSGSAYVFVKPGGGWSGVLNEVAKLTASDAADSDHFGGSVAISGDTAIVGADGDDDDGSGSGSAYVFLKPDGGWSGVMNETAKLTADDAAAYDYFGSSVAVSGDSAIVGAYSDDNGGGTSSGSAYVFKKGSGWTNGSGNQAAKLTASDAAANDYFGRSVAISGDTAIVGADGDDDSGNSSGSAYVFINPGGGWSDMTQTAKLTAGDAAAYDYFGESVAISGNTAIVGAYGDSDTANYSGSAYVFVKPEAGWSDASSETVKLTADDGAYDDHFGRTVAVSGDTAIIGAYKNDDDGTDSGSAYVFCITAIGADAYPKGDLNGDNVVDLTDAIIALQVITGVTPSQLRTDYVISGTDVNGDEKVGAEELVYILQEEAGFHEGVNNDSITNTQLSPASPATLGFNQIVTVYFDYYTDESSGVRFFIQPYTNSSATPNNVYNPSPSVYPSGNGSASGYFSISYGATTVDQVKITMKSGDQNELLYELFVPVEYSFQ